MTVLATADKLANKHAIITSIPVGHIVGIMLKTTSFSKK
jgi:hypothetical protein